MNRYFAWLSFVCAAVAASASCSEDFTQFPSTSVGAGGTGATGGAGTGGNGCTDADMDGVTNCEGDCDDSDPLAYPGAPEVCGDGADTDCDGSADPPGCNGMGTYVSSAVGNDSNPGTQSLPVATISKGIQNAVALGKIQPVFVAGGHYTEKVTLVEGVSLLGGHQCDASDCSWVRDLGNIDTAILDTDAQGVYAGMGITRATLVEGFRIQGLANANPGSMAEAVALTLDHGSPTLAANTINGPDVSGCSICGSVAVSIRGPMSDPLGALLTGNEVNGGDSPNWSIGVSVDFSALAEIARNTLRGGNGDWTRTVTVGGGGSQALIVGNAIDAGSCTAPNGTSFGIFVGNGEATIDKNRINITPASSVSCLTSSWSGGIEGGPGIATITNNVIRGMQSPRSAAVVLRDGEQSLGQVVLNSNTLDGAGVSNNNLAFSAALVLGPLVNGNNGFVGLIRSNIFLGGVGVTRFGVYEDGLPTKTLHPAALDTNDFFVSSSGPGSGSDYRLWNGSVGSTLTAAQVNMQAAFAVFGNFAADPDLDASYHLQNVATNPCVDGGTGLGPPPSDDIDGEVRPQGNDYDVGADEAG